MISNLSSYAAPQTDLLTLTSFDCTHTMIFSNIHTTLPCNSQWKYVLSLQIIYLECKQKIIQHQHHKLCFPWGQLSGRWWGLKFSSCLPLSLAMERYGCRKTETLISLMKKEQQKIITWNPNIFQFITFLWTWFFGFINPVLPSMFQILLLSLCLSG